VEDYSNIGNEAALMTVCATGYSDYHNQLDGNHQQKDGKQYS
jgi:hypothetical protein